MNRNVTALYRTYQVADLVRQRLVELGISRSDIHIIPDRDETAGTGGYAGTSTAGTGDITAPGTAAGAGDYVATPTDRDRTAGTGDYTATGTSTDRTGELGSFGRTDGVGDQRYSESRYMDDLHDLGLPDEDLRTYQQSVRRGDYVVSVEVDEGDVPRVQEVMRRPESETYDIDARGTEFSSADLIAHSDTGRMPLATDRRGERDSAYTDPYTRTYRRGTPGGGDTL